MVRHDRAVARWCQPDGDRLASRSGSHCRLLPLWVAISTAESGFTVGPDQALKRLTLYPADMTASNSVKQRVPVSPTPGHVSAHLNENGEVAPTSRHCTIVSGGRVRSRRDIRRGRRWLDLLFASGNTSVL